MVRGQVMFHMLTVIVILSFLYGIFTRIPRFEKTRDGPTDGQMDRRMDGRTDGWTDPHLVMP